MNEDDVFTLTPEGAAALAEDRIAAALEALPGFVWDPDELAETVHAAASAALAR